MLLKDKTVVHFGKFLNPPLLVSCWSRKYVIDFSDPDQKKHFPGPTKLYPIQILNTVCPSALLVVRFEHGIFKW